MNNSRKGKVLDLRNPDFQVIDCVNWKGIQYKPEVRFKISNDAGKIYLRFEVREKYIRAVETNINGKVYEDSCVEFFFSPLSDGNYYNFEFSCIGVPHVAYGPDRHQREFLPVEIIRQMEIKPLLGTTPFEEKEGDFLWNLEIIIPINCFIHSKLSSFHGLKSKANFYKCGDLTSIPHYLSWNPIGTEKPDFHQYPFFGDLLMA